MALLPLKCTIKGTILILINVNFPHLDSDVPCTTFYGVYISQLISFASACSHIDDFNKHNLLITNKTFTTRLPLIIIIYVSSLLQKVFIIKILYKSVTSYD